MTVEQHKAAPRAVQFGHLDFTPRFAYGEQATIAEVTGTGDGTVLGIGFVRLTNAKIPWTVTYDEVVLVLEGALTIRTSEGDLEAGPQDCIWLPRNTALTYISKSALVFYAIHPSNWADSSP